MDALIGSFGAICVIFCVGWTVINLFRRKPLKKPLLGILIGLAMFIGGMAFTISTENDTVIEETWTPESTQAPVPNETSMVDYIARTTKEDLQTNGIDKNKVDEAIAFIRNNHPNYYKDNATMEQAMRYGYYLEYAYTNTTNDKEKTMRDLGTDVTQAVKYVYRGAETVDSHATQTNLEQISEHLSNLSM